MVEAYGLTGVTTAATANPVLGTRKPGSVGLPDAKCGESPMAFVIPKHGQKPTEEELMQFCKENLVFDIVNKIRL